MPEANELLNLHEEWRNSTASEHRRQIWQRMLEIYTDQVFTIGRSRGCCSRSW